MISDEVTQKELEQYENLRLYHTISNFALNKLESQIEDDKTSKHVIIKSCRKSFSISSI